MSKVTLDFETFKQICLGLAEKIKRYEVDEIVAVHRGGMVAAAIISKQLKLPCGAFFPQTSSLHLVNPESKRIVFIEDLVAQGRTYTLIKSRMEPENITWFFVPILIDGTSELDKIVDDYGLKTNLWMVMPWEDNTLMVEGDRGLFRERSDMYGL